MILDYKIKSIGIPFYNKMSYRQKQNPGSYYRIKDNRGTNVESARAKFINPPRLHKELPKIYQTDIPEKVAKSLDNENSIILKAPTGIGKSVCLVKSLAEHYKRGIIAVPNRPAVLALGDYTSKLFPKYQIGYRMSDDTSSDINDDVTIMTTGYTLEYTLHNGRVLMQPLNLVIDEAHESSWQTDLLTRISFYYRKKNKSLKVILSSATLNDELFSINKSRNVELIGIPDAKPNIITEYLPSEGVLGIDTIKKILSSLIGVHTLIIFPGEEEISRFISILEETENLPIMRITQLHSKLTKEEMQEATTIGDEWTVILSTNIAESAITIKKLGAVIDTGYRKVATTGLKGMRLEKVKAAKSNIIQSTGRCGREGTQGRAFVLFHKEVHDRLEEYPEGEVHRNPLFQQLYRLIHAKLPIYEVFDDEKLLPKVDRDLAILESHRMLTKNGGEYKLTATGEMVSRLQLSLRSGEFLFSVIKNCPKQIWYYGVVVACWIDLNGDLFASVRSKFREPSDSFQKRIKKLREKQLQFVDCEKDYLDTVLTIFKLDPAAKDAGLNVKVLKMWKRGIKNTLDMLYSMKINIEIYSIDNDVIKSHLMYSMYTVYEDCIKDYNSRLPIERHSNFYEYERQIPLDSYILDGEECFVYEYIKTDKILALGEFINTRNECIYNKVVKMCQPEPTTNLIKATETITDIWSHQIFPLLDIGDICTFMKVFEKYE